MLIGHARGTVGWPRTQSVWYFLFQCWLYLAASAIDTHLMATLRSVGVHAVFAASSLVCVLTLSGCTPRTVLLALITHVFLTITAYTFLEDRMVGTSGRYLAMFSTIIYHQMPGLRLRYKVLSMIGIYIFCGVSDSWFMHFGNYVTFGITTGFIIAVTFYQDKHSRYLMEHEAEVEMNLEEAQSHESSTKKVLELTVPQHVIGELNAWYSGGMVGALCYELVDVPVLFVRMIGVCDKRLLVDPKELLRVLNRVLLSTDDAVVGCQYSTKIKTIGDVILVAGCETCGSSRSKAACVESVRLALHLIGLISAVGCAESEYRVDAAAGVHVGGVTAAVMGKVKFFYDVFGDTVNVASRMMSCAPRNGLRVTSDTTAYLNDAQVWNEEGGYLSGVIPGVRLTETVVLAVKGKDRICTCLLERNSLFGYFE